ncbi:ABC transporter substrate-binding protein [Phaeobacter gallaeciensis]|uniref:ABC transporter substrate-binding protein n=1 Tax=Phaeobacter gallaeciensis TaxID=60890 RepID=A0A1B0ZP04_9RHOB|nr:MULTISPECIES: ABC transporter substrate-binding protein [Phaeobacter]MEE2634064.1 ABC transporter substrate-binding protein [Pseudomonadota bacterium]ANP35906.1 ABC transporter substrate-binding protein [Phaeobacter gallaeciensis]MDE4062340.1 ABC transporter substrate-binding protein [Phaeobacter gallaeciensis]MDE4125242.1 ABC transporter substrate-binding protein [Phaeobacter gallaeciensis]MDE4129920.1 ABC transporter substrate-binding protein [Phaeobacter gallaeciensis]
MRFLVFSLALMVSALGLALPASSFEVEEFRRFGPEGAPALRVLSTTDMDVLAPLVESFLADRPGTAIEYTTVSSAVLMEVVTTGSGPQARFDIAVSSAMDLQTKLANDGYTRHHRSAATDGMPDWANWRDHVFAFSQEPASLLLSRAAFNGLELPRTRQDLIRLLRQHPDRFRGRIGTYDIATSGLGYLFATQDARTSDSYWRLMEIFGGLEVRLYCCSGQMIRDVARGDLAIAYNVLGSYALARTDLTDSIVIIDPQDYTNMMLRTAVILENAQQPDLAGAFVDHLLQAAWGSDPDPGYPFHRYPVEASDHSAPLRPIQLGPGLLVFLDRLKRARFLNEWHSAVSQK